jgi:hypothetical protein
MEAEAALGGHDICRQQRRAVAELRLCSLHGNVEPAACVDLAGGEGFARTNDDEVGLRLAAQRVERFTGRNAEAPALARREPPEARVAAELAPGPSTTGPSAAPSPCRSRKSR